MKIETKQQLCVLLGEIVNATDLTAKELTQGTKTIREATLKALTLAHSKTDKTIAIMEKYSGNLKFGIAKLELMEIKIQQNIGSVVNKLNQQETDNVIEMIEQFMTVLCFSTERYYNGQEVSSVMEHYRKLIAKLEMEVA